MSDDCNIVFYINVLYNYTLGDESKEENEAKEFACICFHGLMFGYLSENIYNLVNMRMWLISCDVSVIYRDVLGLFYRIKYLL